MESQARHNQLSPDGHRLRYDTYCMSESEAQTTYHQCGLRRSLWGQHLSLERDTEFRERLPELSKGDREHLDKWYAESYFDRLHWNRHRVAGFSDTRQLNLLL